MPIQMKVSLMMCPGSGKHKFVEDWSMMLTYVTEVVSGLEDILSVCDHT